MSAASCVLEQWCTASIRIDPAAPLSRECNNFQDFCLTPQSAHPCRAQPYAFRNFRFGTVMMPAASNDSRSPCMRPALLASSWAISLAGHWTFAVKIASIVEPGRVCKNAVQCRKWSDLKTGHRLWGIGVPENNLPVLACSDDHLVDLAELEGIDGPAVSHKAADDSLALAIQHGQAAVYRAGKDVLQLR